MTTTDEKWPTKPITLVVPYSTGGTADRQARALAPYLQEALGVPILVENRTGGAGAVGTMSHLQRDPDDGYFLIYQSHPHFDSGIIRGGGYKFTDFDYLGVTHSSPQAIFVKADSKVQTFEDLANWIRSKPGQLTYAMMPGTWSEVVGITISDALGVLIRGVPFDGGGPMRTALLGGQVDFLISDIEGTLAGLGDKAKVIAIGDIKPYPFAPQVPLLNDAVKKVVPNVSFPGMFNMRFVQVKKGFKDKYPDRWDKLAKAFEGAMANPKFQEWARSQGLYMEWIGPDRAESVMKASHSIILKYQDLFK
ncbi:MAG: tripartite tricarboxylate transporter substrate binding protein [Bacillota bacterium]